MSLLIGLRKADDEEKDIMMNEQPIRESAEVTLSAIWISLSSLRIQTIVAFFVKQRERERPAVNQILNSALRYRELSCHLEGTTSFPGDSPSFPGKERRSPWVATTWKLN
jgi:hypothetical protein